MDFMEKIHYANISKKIRRFHPDEDKKGTRP